MFARVIISILIVGMTSAQIDGQFWWLNEKLSELRGTKPHPATIDDDYGFDTDESDKVIFEDMFYRSSDKSKAIEDVELNTNDVKEDNIEDNDIFDFVFPDDRIVFPKNKLEKNEASLSSKLKNITDSININEDKITFQPKEKNDTLMKKNICEYMPITLCISRAGFVTEQKNRIIDGTNFICCVGALSLIVKGSSRVVYPDDLPAVNRSKRSNANRDLNPNLEQWKALMLRKYNTNQNKDTSNVATHKINQQIVTPDEDYVDPYLNVKSPNFNPNQQTGYASTGDNDGQDSTEDYTLELPRPGFFGVHSDHGRRPHSWTFVGNKNIYGASDDNDEVDSKETFGYGAVDPRLTAKPYRRGTIKLTAASLDESSNIEKQTIGYQANPDFKVLDGFKLPILFRNKNRNYFQGERKSTTESSKETDNNPTPYFTKPLDEPSAEDFDSFLKADQIYKDCGKSDRTATESYESDKQIGNAVNGSHPWIALIVKTKQPESVLCYATILHPRIAITVADCVYRRTKPGVVTLVAGLWNLSNERRNTQQRMPSVFIHPRYKKGELGHNLALLHWKRPIRLGVTVQPVCLSEPQIGDDSCKFFGWGGYDQEIQKHSRWQKATILSSEQCKAELSIDENIELPQNEFCASVDSQTSVTGVGGPLICTLRGRASATGVAMWRDQVIVLISAREWAMEIFDTFI